MTASKIQVHACSHIFTEHVHVVLTGITMQFYLREFFKGRYYFTHVEGGKETSAGSIQGNMVYMLNETICKGTAMLSLHEGV